jgi:hypothetical protein
VPGVSGNDVYYSVIPRPWGDQWSRSSHEIMCVGADLCRLGGNRVGNLAGEGMKVVITCFKLYVRANGASNR